jgi:hypothetical protein
MEKSSNDKIQTSNQIQNPNVKIFSKTIHYLPFSHCTSSPLYATFKLMSAQLILTTHTFRSTGQRCFACGRVTIFVLFDTIDKSMNGISDEKYTTPQYFKTVQP